MAAPFLEKPQWRYSKRQSNKVVGQLGLGCKAAFAYTDKFNITSWQNGEKKVYCAYIDETGVGKIALLASDTSNERDGIEIQIPVKQVDYYSFGQETRELLKFFEPIPRLYGGNQEPLEKTKYSLEGQVDSIKFGMVDSNNQNAYNSRSYFHTTVIMGGVPYKVNSNEIRSTIEQDNNQNYYDYEKFFRLGVHFFVNIGDVDVAAHREALEYTDRTKKVLLSYFMKARDEALKIKAKQVSAVKTYKEANELYCSIQCDGVFWRDIVINHSWNNKKLDGKIIPDNDVLTIWYPIKKSNGHRWVKINSIPCGSVNLFMVDNVKGWKQKMGNWLEYKPNLSFSKVFILERTTEDDKEWNDFYEERCIDEYEITPISKCIVPKEELDKIRGTKRIAKRISFSHVGNVFVLKDRQNREYSTTKSKDWERIKEIPDSEKHYVVLDRFFVMCNGTEITIRQFEKMLAIAESLNFKIDKVYGVKASQEEKLDDTWKPLIPEIKAVIQKSNMLQSYINIDNFEKETPLQLFSFIGLKAEFPKGSIADKLIKKTTKLVEDIRANNSIERNKDIFVLLGLWDQLTRIKPDYSLKELIQDAKNTYPLTAKLGIFPGAKGGYGYSLNYRLSKVAAPDMQIRDVAPSIVDYVTLIGK